MAFTIIHIFTTASSYTSLFLIGAGIIFHIGDCMPQHPSTRNPIHHVTHKSPLHLNRCPKRDEEPLHLAIDAARLACWNSFYWRRRSLRYQPGTIKRRHRAHTTHRCTMSFYIVTDYPKTPNHKSRQSNLNPAISLGGPTPRNHKSYQSNMTPPSTVLNLCPSPSIINSTGRKKCRFVLAPDTTPPAPDSVDVAIRAW